MSLFRKIINLGITVERNPLNQEYIRITNRINLLYIFGVSLPLIAASLILTDDGINSYGRFLLLIVCSLFSLFLNKIHQTRSAKIITAISPFFIVLVFPIFINHFVHAGMFLWMPYGIMTMGTVSFFIFSYEKEKRTMITVIGLYVVLIVAFDELVMAHYNQLPDLDFIINHYVYYSFAKITITLLLYSAFFTFKLMYHKNRMLLLNLTKELDEKNQALLTLNTSLESIVAERTAKLALQNERIKSLAYTNAHEIRAHVARIMGLLNLKNQDVAQNEKDFCDAKISENIHDLEKVTHKLSNELIEEE